MMIKLYTYFGVVGIVSVLAWLTALTMLVYYGRHPRRYVYYARALVVALAAYFLGQVNSDRISAIQVDRTAELEQARLAQIRLREEEQGIAAKVRFAEDTTRDRLDLAGVSKDDMREMSGVTNAAEAAGEPEYRKGGKQSRDPSKKASSTRAERVAEEAAGEDYVIRMLPQADVLRANMLDHMNLFAVALTWWLCLVALVWDYLWRFQRFVMSPYPLPLSGGWLDACFPKGKACLCPKATEDAVRRFLDHVVRKGETFVYLGKADPLPAVSGLARIRIGRLGLFRFPKIVLGQGAVPDGSSFAFDAVWFGRYGVVVADPMSAMSVFQDLLDWLTRMRSTRARCRQTVNVVWALDVPLAAETIDSFARLAADTNFRLVVMEKGTPTPDRQRGFDEIVAL